MTNDEPSNPGEVREDIPLRPSEQSGFAYKFGGLRLIIASFAFLSAAVTIALVIQIYKGDYEVVPHGSVATDNKDCSRIGTDVLKLGGNSVDAAIAAAFCLAVVNPHTTGLDATGTMMFYNYRKSRSADTIKSPPIVVDFSDSVPSNVPKLVRGLSFIHDKFGLLDWNELVEPSVELARSGFNAPATLIEAAQTVGNTELFKNIAAGNNIKFPSLASLLSKIANTNSSSLFSPTTDSDITTTVATAYNLNDFTVYLPPIPTAANLKQFLNTSFISSQMKQELNGADIVYRTAHNLNLTMQPSSGTASTIAVIDKDELYVSLITGMHNLLGSQTFTPDGYISNLPHLQNTHSENIFLPMIVTSQYTCGMRVVLSCGDAGGAGQVLITLLEDSDSPIQLGSALESPRLQKLNDKYLGYEKSHNQVFKDIILQSLIPLIPLTVAPQPYPTCNAVQQIGDNLSSHADSRGGGLASRF